MCGIVGLFGEYDKEQVQKATKLLEHRGPDDFDYFFDKNIGLGHRRLSIIDLSKRARQPMTNENGDLIIVYNGEIYNFKEIRAELGKHSFNSESDTEVILHAYEEFGEECIKKFNGIFAFCIYDAKKKTLFLARDRAGIKPLYYFKEKGKFGFASEIKALFELGSKKKINEKILYDYFNYQILIGQDTLFKNILAFPPAHYGVYKNGKLELKRYWDAEYKTEINASENFYAEKLRNLLDESVARQLVSDVPVGAFFSGGLDSATIVALAKKHYPNIKTFTAGFDVYPEEINIAERVAQKIGTEQHSVEIDSEKFIKELPRLIWHYDMPLSFSSSVPLYFVAKLAKEKVKVVLTGEGSDELFGGYRRYYLIQRALALEKRNIPGKNIAISLAKKIFQDSRYKKILELASKGLKYEYITGINAIVGDERKNIKIGEQGVLTEQVKKLFNEKETSFTNKLLYLDFNTYLTELLMKQDKMSMAASIESRVPFLDNEVIEFANSIPSELKLNGKIGKYILRQSVKKIVPKEILKRKKIGFTVPLNIWFKKELQGYLKDNLLNKEVYKYFDENYVKGLIEQQKRRNNTLQLWAILNFKIWMDRFDVN